MDDVMLPQEVQRVAQRVQRVGRHLSRAQTRVRPGPTKSDNHMRCRLSPAAASRLRLLVSWLAVSVARVSASLILTTTCVLLLERSRQNT